MDRHTIRCQTFRQWVKEEPGLLVLDVRDEEKFGLGSLNVAGIPTRNAPYVHMKEQDQPFTEETANSFRAATIVTVCTTGNKAQKAAALLREKGFRAVALEGGLTAWNSAEENRNAGK